MGPSWWQILIIVALFVLLFGRGKISELMGDVAKGIKSFKSGLADSGEEKADPKTIDHDTPAPSAQPETTAGAPPKQKSG